MLSSSKIERTIILIIITITILTISCSFSTTLTPKATETPAEEIVFVTPIVIEVPPTPLPSPTNLQSSEPENITNSDHPTTASDLPCNAAELIMDLSIPDDTFIPRGESFTKTWMMRNAGSCTWTPNFAIIFAGGDQMSANTYNPISQYVYPGETINISINFTAPLYGGCYQGNWLFQDSDGNRFGIGYNSQQFFWVAICVEDDNGAGFAPC